MGKIDKKFTSDSCQCSVRCIEQRVCGYIVLRSEPFTFEDTPQRFCKIEMRTVRRQEEKKESAFPPYGSEFSNEFSTVDTGIVKNHKGVFFNTEGKPAKKVCDLVCGKN